MKLVLIGGGRDEAPYETKALDESIVKLANKKNPKLLFIGFAQKFEEEVEDYFRVIKSNYEKLGCSCEQLSEADVLDLQTTKEKILKADIIYVGGGNTLRLMSMFRKYNIGELLKEAGDNGTVLCGTSAGAICWCNYGNSDSRKLVKTSAKYVRVKGLGFVDVLLCPHYNVKVERREYLKRMMSKTKGVALALDNCTALQIEDNNYKVLKSKDNVRARKCYFQNGEYIRDIITDTGKVEDLITKQ